MGLSSILLKTGEVLRPVITKIVPQKMLSAMKAKVVSNAASNLPEDAVMPYELGKYPKGVNLIGNYKGDTGLAESARIMVNLVDNSEEPHVIKDFFVPPGDSRRNTSLEGRFSEEVKYDINIINVNASEFVIAYLNLGREVWDYRYNIGYWAWELEEFPEEWLPSIKLADELWTPSDFVTDTLKKYTDKPVLTVPHVVSPMIDAKYDRKHFKLPEDKFLFLVMFNSGSVMERKNPLGAIKAFNEAFAKDEETKAKYKDVGLVIKIGADQLAKEDEDLIRSVIDKYDNIYFMCGFMNKTEVNSLLADVDVYVSLHRSEGFGLMLADSMYLGTPVIATNWSGNTEFMNNDVACMVDYNIIELDKEIPPFKKGSKWADAKIEDAAQYMIRLYEDKQFYDRISKNGARYAREHLSVERSAKIVSQRIKEIHREE